jgi:DNA-binding response OmpR family regulator
MQRVPRTTAFRLFDRQRTLSKKAGRQGFIRWHIKENMEESPDTILILEPEDDLRISITTALKSQDYRVIVAADWKDALSLFQRQQPEVMLLDALQTEITGIELLRYLRVQGSLDYTIVILISALGYPDLINKAKIAGAKDFLVKPFEVDVLIRKIRKHLTELRSK